MTSPYDRDAFDRWLTTDPENQPESVEEINECPLLAKFPKHLPPADPDNPETRLLRAIFGACPDCDETDPHENHENLDDREMGD